MLYTLGQDHQQDLWFCQFLDSKQILWLLACDCMHSWIIKHKQHSYVRSYITKPLYSRVMIIKHVPETGWLCPGDFCHVPVSISNSLFTWGINYYCNLVFRLTVGIGASLWVQKDTEIFHPQLNPLPLKRLISLRYSLYCLHWGSSNNTKTLNNHQTQRKS